LAVALVPASAAAQDATAVFVLSGPPFLLAFVAALVVRIMWLRRVPGSRLSPRWGVPLSILEFVLWLLAAGFAALMYFQEKLGGAVMLIATLVAIVAINRRFAPPRASWVRAMALAAVFPIVWVVVQSAWYGAVVAWGDYR
jgi:hypothetical protein